MIASIARRRPAVSGAGVVCSQRAGEANQPLKKCILCVFQCSIFSAQSRPKTKMPFQSDKSIRCRSIFLVYFLKEYIRTLESYIGVRGGNGSENNHTHRIGGTTSEYRNLRTEMEKIERKKSIFSGIEEILGKMQKLENDIEIPYYYILLK